MKRLLRLISLSLVIIVLCASFTGCDRMIKDILASEVTKLENGNLRVDGNEYVMLPEGDYILNYSYADFDRFLFMAEEGVPTLISYSGYENDARITKDGVFIETYASVYYGDVEAYYCRADLYDSVAVQIKNGIEYPLYGYEIPLDDVGYEYETTYLTEEQVSLVNEIFETAMPRVVSADVQWEYDSSVAIGSYSRDGFFYKDVCCLCLYNGSLYLEVYDWVNYDETTTLYRIPEKYRPVFEEILAKGDYNYGHQLTSIY